MTRLWPAGGRAGPWGRRAGGRARNRQGRPGVAGPASSCSGRRRPRRDEAGQLAGAEALPFALLVFVAGTLLVANAWAVVDAKAAASSAAREATRAYVESPVSSDPRARADAAGREAVRGMGRDPDKLRLVSLEADFSRCAQVRFEARYPVPALTIPFVGRFGTGFWAVARHGEIVDPYRSGVPRGGC